MPDETHIQPSETSLLSNMCAIRQNVTKQTALEPKSTITFSFRTSSARQDANSSCTSESAHFHQFWSKRSTLCHILPIFPLQVAARCAHYLKRSRTGRAKVEQVEEPTQKRSSKGRAKVEQVEQPTQKRSSKGRAKVEQRSSKSSNPPGKVEHRSSKGRASRAGAPCTPHPTICPYLLHRVRPFCSGAQVDAEKRAACGMCAERGRI
jgi:hypothetical protein